MGERGMSNLPWSGEAGVRREGKRGGLCCFRAGLETEMRPSVFAATFMAAAADALPRRAFLLRLLPTCSSELRPDADEPVPLLSPSLDPCELERERDRYDARLLDGRGEAGWTGVAFRAGEGANAATGEAGRALHCVGLADARVSTGAESRAGLTGVDGALVAGVEKPEPEPEPDLSTFDEADVGVEGVAGDKRRGYRSFSMRCGVEGSVTMRKGAGGAGT